MKYVQQNQGVDPAYKTTRICSSPTLYIFHCLQVLQIFAETNHLLQDFLPSKPPNASEFWLDMKSVVSAMHNEVDCMHSIARIHYFHTVIKPHLIQQLLLQRNTKAEQQSQQNVHAVEQMVDQSHFVQCMRRDNGRMASIVHSLLSRNAKSYRLTLEDYLYLNRRGHLMNSSDPQGEDDSIEEYHERIIQHYRNLLLVESILMKNPFGTDEENIQIFGYEKQEQIPFNHFLDPIIQNTLHSLFDVQVDWVPGFYSNKHLPLFAGGVSYETYDHNLTFVQLHPSLRNRKRYGTLNRSELIIHELIHSARMNLNSVQFEEEFAYSTSDSLLRRVLAPITQRPTDSILFTIFAMFSIASDLPRFPRWISILTKFPLSFIVLAGVVRLLQTKRALKHAQMYLEYLGCFPQRNVKPFLFRLTDQEILELSREYSTGLRVGWHLVFRNKYKAAASSRFQNRIRRKAQKSIRWRILEQYLSERCDTPAIQSSL